MQNARIVRRILDRQQQYVLPGQAQCHNKFNQKATTYPDDHTKMCFRLCVARLFDYRPQTIHPELFSQVYSSCVVWDGDREETTCATVIRLSFRCQLPTREHVLAKKK